MVNGEEHEVPESQTISELVATLGLDEKPCAIERNRSLVPHRDHGTTPLAEGDRVEIVTLVGGG